MSTGTGDMKKIERCRGGYHGGPERWRASASIFSSLIFQFWGRTLLAYYSNFRRFDDAHEKHVEQLQSEGICTRLNIYYSVGLIL